MEKHPATFSPRKNKSNRYCCVPQCNSKACRDITVRFHRFPKNGELVRVENNWGSAEKCDRRKVWIHRLKIVKNVSNTMFVCSKHFLRSDYILPDVPSKHRHLKKTAVPSLNLPKSSTDGLLCGDRKRKREQNSMLRRNLQQLSEIAIEQEEGSKDKDQSNPQDSVFDDSLPPQNQIFIKQEEENEDEGEDANQQHSVFDDSHLLQNQIFIKQEVVSEDESHSDSLDSVFDDSLPPQNQIFIKQEEENQDEGEDGNQQHSVFDDSHLVQNEIFIKQEEVSDDEGEDCDPLHSVCDDSHCLQNQDVKQEDETTEEHQPFVEEGIFGEAHQGFCGMFCA